MSRLFPARAEAELRHLAQRFAHWRRNRPPPRGRLPKPLWEQAVALRRVLSLTRVAKRLGLCPTRLKKRWEDQPRTARSTALPPLRNCGEVAVAAVGRASTTEVAVHRTAGARLRLTSREANSALGSLLQTFLECP